MILGMRSRVVVPSVTSKRVFSVYDVSNPQSFERMGNWLTEVDTFSSYSSVQKMLVANKIDKVRSTQKFL